jgi:ATP-dependent DNA ligase
MVDPMLLTEVDDRDSVLTKPWLFQIKENGVRSIIHIKNNKIVGIRSRSNNPTLYCYPELKDIQFNCGTAIIDAEICVMKNGKSIFYDGVNKRRSTPTNKILQDYPVTIIAFDIIQLESEVLVNKPYKDRIQKLGSIISDSTQFKVIEATMDGVALWDRVVAEDHEGLVAKDPNGVYEIGKRVKSNIKIKNYKHTNVLVEKTEVNNKGTKVWGKTLIGDKTIQVECQIQNTYIDIGSTVNVKYLDIVGDRMIQPTFGGYDG